MAYGVKNDKNSALCISPSDLKSGSNNKKKIMSFKKKPPKNKNPRLEANFSLAKYKMEKMTTTMM